MGKKLKDFCLTRQHGAAEWIVLLLYIAGVIAVSCFHEPWFDEAQAWQIARCSSWYELLFVMPHYEGHPQLWHLMLAPFAKLGAPFEPTLAAINLTLCAAAVALLLWKSPFPKVVRCILPFTYFFFYQFGVVARPYCIMMLAFFLAAMTYRDRNEKPVRYILSLCLLCTASAYGILFAGGLCMVWVLEILQEYMKSREWGKVFRDRRPYALLGILILALFFGLSILPAKDCYYPGYDMAFIERFEKLHFLLVVPCDSVFGCYLDIDVIKETPAGLYTTYIGGALIWAFMLVLAKKNRKLLTFLVPYLLYLGFSIMKYFSVHHIGSGTLFFVFFFWIMLGDKEEFHAPEIFGKIYSKLDTALVRAMVPLTGLALLCAPVVYSIGSSVTDVKNYYGPRQIVEFIKENDLEEAKLLCTWTYFFEDEQFFDVTRIPSNYPELAGHYPDSCGLAVTTLPYFDENIFMNFNVSYPEKGFITHKVIDEEEEFALWREKGLPDFIFGYCPIDVIYDEQMLDGVQYVPVEVFEHGNIWKLSQLDITTTVYIREDLLGKYPGITRYEY